MGKGIYKTLFVQLGILLCYQSVLFYSNISFLFPAICIHTFILLFLAFRSFRKKETQKALHFLVPFLIVLLIGIGSCGGFFALGSASFAESLKEKHDSAKEERLRKRAEKQGDTSRNMGHPPHSHKGIQESGIPNRRYRWLKKGAK